MKQIYLITGAAGHLGSTIIRQLKKRQQSVAGLLLPSEKPVITGRQIHYLHGDVTRKESLYELFEACAGAEIIVIHTAGIIDISGRLTPQMKEVNIVGTKNMLELAQEYHVKRFVHVSSVHAIPEKANGFCIAEVPVFSPDRVRGGYAKTKAAASQAVLDAVSQGLDAVIVHPSGIIGPYDNGNNHLVQLIRDFLSGKMPFCVSGGYDFVDVRDVARGCILAAQKGRCGACYILNGAYLSLRQLLTLCGHYYHKKKPMMLPMMLAKLVVPSVAFFARLTGRRPLFTDYSLYTVESNSLFSHARATRELGYQPRPIARTAEDTVRWIRQQNA